MEVIKTAREREREKLHSHICQLYTEIRQKNPKLAPCRIFMSIAAHIGWTVPGVRKVLIKNNLYNPGEK